MCCFVLHGWLLLLNLVDFYVRGIAKWKYRTPKSHSAVLHKYTGYTKSSSIPKWTFCSRYNSVFYIFYSFKRDNQIFIWLVRLSLCAETKHNKNSLNGFWKEWDKVTEWTGVMLDRMAGMNQVCYKIYALKRKETNKPTRMHTYFYSNTSAYKTIYIH